MVDIETRQTMDFNLILGSLLGNHIENRNKGHHTNDNKSHKNNQLATLSLSSPKNKSGAFLCYIRKEQSYSLSIDKYMLLKDSKKSQDTERQKKINFLLKKFLSQMVQNLPQIPINDEKLCT